MPLYPIYSIWSFHSIIQLKISTRYFKYVLSYLSGQFNPMFGYDSFISSPAGRWVMTMACELW